VRIVSSGLAAGVLVLLGCVGPHAGRATAAWPEVVREDAVKITEVEAFVAPAPPGAAGVDPGRW